MGKRKTHDEYVAALALTVVGEYQGSTKKITHRCMKGHEFSPNHALRDRGKQCLLPRSHDDYVAEVVAINAVSRWLVNCGQLAISHRWAYNAGKAKQHFKWKRVLNMRGKKTKDPLFRRQSRR